MGIYAFYFKEYVYVYPKYPVYFEMFIYILFEIIYLLQTCLNNLNINLPNL